VQVHLITKERKPSSDEEFIRKCLQHTVLEICPEKGVGSNTVLESLSHTPIG
jgi:hypothetical protein